MSGKAAAKKFKVQMLETVASLITAAFGLVAALAWNETIKEAITQAVGETGDGLTGLLIYALIVTVIAVVATMLIAYLLSKAKGEADEAEA